MEVLPEHYYKAEDVGGLGKDTSYITEQLEGINYNQKANACLAYSKIYIEEGRTKANISLRKYVAKCKAKNNGNTVALKPI